MLFEDLTIADIRRLFTALMALGGDDMVRKLIERAPTESQPHSRVTMGTLFKLLAQTDGRTVLPEEIVALLKALSHPEKNDQEILAAVVRLVEEETIPKEADDFFDDCYDDDFDNAPEEMIEPPMNEPDVFDEGPDSIFETIESEPGPEEYMPDIDDESFFTESPEELAEPEPLPDLPTVVTMQEILRQESNDFYERLFGKPDLKTPATPADRRFNEYLQRIKQGEPRSDLVMTSTIGATVIIDHSLSLQHRVNHANCFSNIDLIVSNDLRPHRVSIADRIRGRTTEQCQVVTLSREATATTIAREFRRLGYRHATIDELVAFAATHPLLDQLPTSNQLVRVIATGTKLSSRGSSVPCLRVSKRHRGEFELTAEFTADLWQPGNHFLVIKKS